MAAFRIIALDMVVSMLINTFMRILDSVLYWDIIFIGIYLAIFALFLNNECIYYRNQLITIMYYTWITDTVLHITNLAQTSYFSMLIYFAVSYSLYSIYQNSVNFTKKHTYKPLDRLLYIMRRELLMLMRFCCLLTYVVLIPTYWYLGSDLQSAFICLSLNMIDRFIFLIIFYPITRIILDYIAFYVSNKKP